MPMIQSTMTIGEMYSRSCLRELMSSSIKSCHRYHSTVLGREAFVSRPHEPPAKTRDFHWRDGASTTGPCRESHKTPRAPESQMSQTTSVTETRLPGASERVEIHPFHVDVPAEPQLFTEELRAAFRSLR
jgi:hypothetical protein